MSIELPEPARDYFEASNVGDIDRMIARFADDARVKDEGWELVESEAAGDETSTHTGTGISRR